MLFMFLTAETFAIAKMPTNVDRNKNEGISLDEFLTQDMESHSSKNVKRRRRRRRR